MRKYWPTIALGAVFLALLGYMVYSYKFKPVQEKNQVLFETDKAKISSVELNTGISAIVKREAGIFKLFAPEEVPAIQTKLADIFDKSAKIEYTSVISQNESNLQQFGLASPKTTAKINLTDGTQKAFNIGYQTPTEDGYYVSETGKNTVYKVDATQIEVFAQPVSDLIERNIVSEIDKDKSDRIMVSFGNQSLAIEKRGMLWYFGSKQMAQDKVASGVQELKSSVVDGLAAANERVDTNRGPDVRLIVYQEGREAVNLSIFKRDERTYNVFKKGIFAQYYMTSESFDKMKNDLAKLFQESIAQ